LARLAAGTYSEAALGQLSGEALADFAQARAALPVDAMPPLALARYYVYTAPDLERAIAEFAAAERLGATLGRREIEQQADGYRLRAQREAARQPQQAWRDAREAKALYARIPGFDQADAHVKELARIHYGASHRTSRLGRRTRWR
jgi:hypothetical protein